MTAALVAVHAFRTLLWAAVVVHAAVFLVSFAGDLFRRRPGVLLWRLYLVGGALVLVQGLSGVAVYLAGLRPPDSLHLVYGLLSLAGGLAPFGLRPGGFLRTAVAGGREGRTVALVSLTVTALLLRAYQTGTFGP